MNIVNTTRLSTTNINANAGNLINRLGNVCMMAELHQQASLEIVAKNRYIPLVGYDWTRGNQYFKFPWAKDEGGKDHRILHYFYNNKTQIPDFWNHLGLYILDVNTKKIKFVKEVPQTKTIYSDDKSITLFKTVEEMVNCQGFTRYIDPKDKTDKTAAFFKDIYLSLEKGGYSSFLDYPSIYIERENAYLGENSPFKIVNHSVDGTFHFYEGEKFIFSLPMIMAEDGFFHIHKLPNEDYLFSHWGEGLRYVDHNTQELQDLHFVPLNHQFSLMTGEALKKALKEVK